MSKLSNLAESLIGSEIVKLGNDISIRQQRGEQIYNFTIGDFDPEIFPIPQELEDAIVDAYRQGYTNYPPGAGITTLREAITTFIRQDESIVYNLDEIQIASGGRPLIYALFKTVVNPGDKVIYAVPSWNNNYYTQMNAGTPCEINALPENDFMPRAADIAPHLKNAALLCLCTPQNPTGTVFSKAELEKICDMVIAENESRAPGEKKLYVLFDQMYRMLTYGTTAYWHPIALRPEMKKYTISIDAVSKAFAATGVRVGWALGPADVTAKMRALLSHIGAWAPMAEQQATVRFLNNTKAVDTYLKQFKIRLEERLWAIYNGLKELKRKGFAVDAIAPQAAIYLTVKFDLKGLKAQGNILPDQPAVTEYLLAEAGLAIVPFSCFGADKESPWYRISVGTCRLEEVADMLGKLEAALSKLD